ncbi:MAG: hypothetical protein K9L59_11705 [Desulfobacterales bacterium]|nr:hypothetical protein [Desulfobacterales bacterium]
MGFIKKRSALFLAAASPLKKEVKTVARSPFAMIGLGANFGTESYLKQAAQPHLTFPEIGMAPPFQFQEMSMV